MLTIDQHCLRLDRTITGHPIVNLSERERVLSRVSLCRTEVLEDTHGSSDTSSWGTGFVVGINVKVTGPAGTVGRSVACLSPSKPTKEQAGHHSSKNRSGPHNERQAPK